MPIEQVSSNADAANRAWCVKGTHTFTSWGQLDPRPAPFLYSRGTLRSDAAVTIAAKRDVRPEAAATGAASHAGANKHNASLSPPCRQYQCLILKAINFTIMRLTDGGLSVANSCANIEGGLDKFASRSSVRGTHETDGLGQNKASEADWEALPERHYVRFGNAGKLLHDPGVSIVSPHRRCAPGIVGRLGTPGAPDPPPLRHLGCFFMLGLVAHTGCATDTRGARAERVTLVSSRGALFAS